MKKLAAILALALAMAFALPALASAVTLNVYNWGDYIDVETLREFEQRTGIKVVYDTFETNEDMYTKLRNTPTSYDLIFPSDYMVERMIRERMLLPIDMAGMPNAQTYTDPRFLHQVYDPEQAYSVPYTWGTVGILYNNALAAEAPISWDALWDGAYANDILMLNSARDTIGTALKRLGFSLNSVDLDELEAAKLSLIEQSPLVLAYVVDEVKDKMIAGEAALALVWSGDAKYSMDENPDLDYVVPIEGSNLFFDAMCVPASSKNPVEAQMLIDFLCEPEIAMQNYLYVGYAIPNMGAIALLGDEYTDSMVTNPPQEVLDRCEVFRDLRDDVKLYDRIWTEILMSLY